MKKLILFTLLFTVFFSTAQKKELRNANKFFMSGEYSSAIDLLDSAKDLFDSSDDKSYVALWKNSYFYGRF